MEISLAVIVYQAIIVLSIVGAGKFSSAGAAKLVAGLWALWTLVQVTFMSPLFFLQAVTILVSLAFATTGESDEDRPSKSYLSEREIEKIQERVRREQEAIAAGEEPPKYFEMPLWASITGRILAWWAGITIVFIIIMLLTR